MWTFITLLVILMTTIYTYFKRRYTYWEHLGIPYIKPSIPFGNIVQNIPPPVQFENFHKEFRRRGVKHGGIFLFSSPQYFPVDPEIIKSIFIKDFNHFVDRGIYFNYVDQPIMGNLFFIEGQKWRNLRHRLTPTFTSGKMRMMFETMLECSYPLKNRIQELIEEEQAIDAKEILSLFTTDVIGTCAFGINCNSFLDPNSEFRANGRAIFTETVLKAIKGIFQHVFPKLSRKLGLVVVDQKIAEFFTKVVTETYQYRKENNIKRKDFMQLLIDLKDSNDKDNSISMDELIAQAFIFFIAGFDTTATLLTFCLFELGVNKEIQEKLRDEIKEVLGKHNDMVTYDSIKEMKYMDQVIQETLRKYPPLSIFNRVCTEPYKIPGTDITLPKGCQVIVSSLGLHRDPEYFPNPDLFDPNRFSDQNKANIIPGSYIPFGDGPRICIGLRFGLMETKICLVTLLRNFEFSVNERTKVPLEIGLGFITTVKGGVWLNSKQIT